MYKHLKMVYQIKSSRRHTSLTWAKYEKRIPRSFTMTFIECMTSFQSITQWDEFYTTLDSKAKRCFRLHSNLLLLKPTASLSEKLVCHLCILKYNFIFISYNLYICSEEYYYISDKIKN